MSDVTTSVDVQVPVRTAYNQWTQFESFPEFMTGVVAVRQLDDRHTHWVTEVAGAHREFDAEIVEQLPDRHIAWRSTDGDVRHSGMVTFEPLAADQTRVTVDLAWEPDGLLEKAGGALGVDRLQVRADLERFRRFIEERGAETGQWRGEVPEPRQAAEDTAPLVADTHPPATATGIGSPAAATGAGSTAAGIGSPATGAEPPLAGTTNQPGRSSADVVDVLVAQHLQVKDLLDRTAAAEGEPKQQLFAELIDLLKTHEKGEQRVVHPVTRSSIEGGATVANLRLGEEERADRLVAAIENMPLDTDEFRTTFEKLRQAVLAHAEHEENEEFPKLRRTLAPARLRTMAEELVAAQTAQN